MYGFFRSIKGLLLCFCLLIAGIASAEPPDPIAFSWAIELGDIKKVSAWLDEGLDPEFQGNQLGTGLMIASWYGNVDMMKLFVARGANPRRANNNGEQPLQLAAWNGHTEAVKWLLANGARLDRGGNYWEALHYATFNGHSELAKYLIEKGANVNARSPNGSTPLMLAAREGREDMTTFLLESGADTRPKNDWGDSALTLAMRYDHYRLGKMISSPEEFEIAIKAPKEDFGASSRSVSAPVELEELLKKIREAEAQGLPSKELHVQLRKLVEEVRSEAIARYQARQKAQRAKLLSNHQPKSIVVTAKRNQSGGERAQILTGKPAGKQSTKAATSAASKQQVAQQARIAELMRQIRLMEAQGRPAEELRQELYETVEALK